MKYCLALLLAAALCKQAAANDLYVSVAWDGDAGYLDTLDDQDPLHVIIVLTGMSSWINGELYKMVDDNGATFAFTDLPHSGPYTIQVAGTAQGAALHSVVTRHNVFTTQTPYINMPNWTENPNWYHAVSEYVLSLVYAGHPRSTEHASRIGTDDGGDWAEDIGAPN